MAQGETVREIKFRKGDWLTSLERALNVYLASRATAATSEKAEEVALPQIEPIPSSAIADPRVVAQGDHDLNDLLRELRDINETLAALNMGHAEAVGDSSGFHFGQDHPRRF
jgi:hypothetical protein